MASPSPSSTGWRLFGVLCFVLLLSMAYNGYQHYLNGDLNRKNEYVTNNYRVVRDSLRRAPPPAPPRPVIVRPTTIVYRPLPVSAEQLASLRAGLQLDLSQQLRRELARPPARPVVVRAPQPRPVVALRDTVLRKQVAATGQVVSTAAKTGTFEDRWLSLTGVVRPGRPGRPDSLEVKYQLRDEFEVQAYSRRDQHHWWQFRPRRVYVRLRSRNPNARTTGLDSVRVQRR